MISKCLIANIKTQIKKEVYFFRADKILPNCDEPVFVLCDDGTQYTAVLCRSKHRFDGRNKWFICSPSKIRHELKKKVILWAYVPDFAKEDVQF